MRRLLRLCFLEYCVIFHFNCHKKVTAFKNEKYCLFKQNNKIKVLIQKINAIIINSFKGLHYINVL